MKYTLKHLVDEVRNQPVLPDLTEEVIKQAINDVIKERNESLMMFNRPYPFGDEKMNNRCAEVFVLLQDKEFTEHQWFELFTLLESGKDRKKTN